MTNKMQFEEGFMGSKLRRNQDANHGKPCLAISAYAERDRYLDVRFGMRTMTLLLVVCAATVAQSASAQANNQPSLAALRDACAQDAKTLCAGVQQGGGRIIACLKEHKDQLSAQCRQAAGLPANPGSGPAPSAASSPATSSPAVPAPSVSTPASAAKPTKAAPEHVILGEHFVQRTVVDTKQGGMTAATVYVPENWHFEGNVEWNYGWVEVPVATSWHAENPANTEAYFQYSLLRMAAVDAAPRWRQYVKNPKPGDHYPTGAIYMEPIPPLQAMAAFIKKTRGDVANLKWLGQQDLPDLGKALRLDLADWPTHHGIAIKIGYDLNGQAVEEAFFGVYFLGKAGTQAVQAGHQSVGANEFVQTNWGFDGLQSFRAPAGTLDKRMPIYCLMAKSVQYDPKWLARAQAIHATLNQMFNQKLKAGWDSIRASDALMDETMRQQAQFLDNVSRQEVAMRSSTVDDSFLRTGSGGGDGGGRTSADRLSDLLRNVDTMNDPSLGGTTEVSNLGGYNHFTDGFGNYRTYDDPNATPENQGENGSWTRMTAAP
jgi:Cysteine rich repeat